MSEIVEQENWQIDVGGQIYEAKFEELEQWVYEGSLHRQDLVRRGSLRWIEAGRVPSLIRFFNAKENGTAAPVVNSTITEAQSAESLAAMPLTDLEQNTDPPALKNFGQNNFQEFSNFTKSLENFQTQTDFPKFGQKTDVCQIHSELPAFYSCETCANNFCKDCPKSYGANVKICPLCGAMCKSFNRENFQSPQNFRSHTAISEKFGFDDFTKSLVYPFKFKVSLIFGTIFFVFFSFGQSAAAFGGFMLFAALICFLGTNMLSFGILANTLENFSQGKINVDFMPSFDSFSMWDDVVQPFFLSIGAYLISFGLFLAILIGGGRYAFNQTSSAANQEAAQKLVQLNKTRQPAPLPAANPNEAMTVESIEKMHRDEGEKAQQLMEEMNKTATPATVEDLDSSTPSSGAILQSLSTFAFPFFAALLLALIWGIFYFPAACAVAGYTRSFAAVMNVSVGFDTIKRLGFDYFKILLMIFATLAAGVLIINFAAQMLKPFDVPIMGNIPVKIISGIFTFYFSIVFACILGFALYKNSDRLELMKK